MKKIIVPCSNVEDLAIKISQELKAGDAQHEKRRFPDAEHYWRIDTDLKGAMAIVVQSGYPNPNDSIIELTLAVDAAKERNARQVVAVVPYFPYGRQDKTFRPGEALSLRNVVTILKNSGIKSIITADAHFRKTFRGGSLFGLRWKNVTAGALLVNYLKAKFSIRQAHLVSPDFGAGIEVKEAAEATDSTMDQLSKKRTGDWDVDMIAKQLRVQGRDVIVLDDIISTGGTMAKAIELCKKAGAKRVFAAATHGLFIGSAMQKMTNTGVDYIVTTDSVKNETSEVSLAHEIASVL